MRIAAGAPSVRETNCFDLDQTAVTLTHKTTFSLSLPPPLWPLRGEDSHIFPAHVVFAGDLVERLRGQIPNFRHGRGRGHPRKLQPYGLYNEIHFCRLTTVEFGH